MKASTMVSKSEMQKVTKVRGWYRKDWAWITRGSPEFRRRVPTPCECHASGNADGVCEMDGRWVCSLCAEPVKVFS